MHFHKALFVAFLLAVAASLAEAATTTQLVRGDTLSARDASLSANLPTQRYGTAQDLTIKDAKNASKRNHVVLDFNLPDLTGRTVLQAWLRLRQFSGTRPKPSTLRVHPTTQSWVENEVTWDDRSAGVPWATPGGQHAPYWSDRVLASSGTSGNLLSWQVGPILSAYQTGAFGISGSGFLIKADGTSPDRDMSFRSSEFGDTTAAPLLEITSTDLPPAVVNAWAEVQPHQAPEFQSTAFTLYIEDELSGSTPSGTPTGYDVVRIQHGGAVLVTSVEAVTQGLTEIPIESVSFVNDASGCTIQLPQVVNQEERLTIRFQATVQVGVSAREFSLPVLLRLSTSQAGFQAVWPQNADGTAGNGDHLNVTVFAITTNVSVLSVTGPASVSPGQNDAPFQMRVRNTGAATLAVSAAYLLFTRTSSGDANPEFLVSPDPGNPDTLFSGDEKVLNLLVDVLPNAIPGPLSVDGRLIVQDTNTGNAYADLGADTLHVMSVTGAGALITARQYPSVVLPGTRDVELYSLCVWNRSLDPTTVTQLTISNVTSGPGSMAQRDAELDSLSLFADDGNGVFIPTTELLLGRAALSSGAASFSLSLGLAAQDSVRLLVVGDVSLDARDGDVLDLAVQNGDVTLSPSLPFENPWPLSPAGGHTVDGMAAAQITVHPVVPRNLVPGSTRELVLDLDLPGNGYQPDVLQKMNVANLGSAEAGIDLDRLELWKDQGSSGFNAFEDRLLGTLSYTGARWEITGLNESVPVSGMRVFVTANISVATTRPSTVRFAVPSGEDQGVGMASRNSGPLDLAVADPGVLLVTIPDRVAVVGNPIAPGAAPPGSSDLLMLDLTVTNTYNSPRTLNQIAFARNGIGAGSESQQDGNVRVLHLRWDANQNGVLDDFAADPLLGTAAFLGSSARFGGLDVSIPPGTAARLFLTADLSVSARDGDVLGAEVASPLDIVFLEATAVDGSWPATSNAAWTVDGMVAAQIRVLSAGTTTLGPGSGPALAFDFELPGNGYEADALNGIRLVNLGNATPGDLSELRLWQDGGNETYDAGSGDDVDLGALVLQGNAWQSLSMSIPLPASGTRFYVSLSVSPTFVDSARVTLALPMNGIIVASGNDGPVDVTVESGHVVDLSDAPLLAHLALAPEPSTTGQTVTTTLTVENRGTETVNGIIPAALSQNGTGSFAAPGNPTPPSLNLDPGMSGTFQWSLAPALAGQVTLSTRVSGTGQTSLLPRSSLTTTSVPHQIFQEATSLRVSALEFMPYSVTVGQGGVVPLNLTFTNPGNGLTSPVTLSALRIRIEDENGAGIVPSNLLSRLTVSEGQTIFADKMSIETSGATVDLTLGPPFARARVSPGDPVTLSLQLHIHPTTSVSRFRIVIMDATWMVAKDAISDAPVTVTLDSGSFPVRTGLASVVSEAVLVRAQAAPPETLRVDPGQSNVDLLSFTLDNVPGSGVASTVRVGSVTVVACDASGQPLGNAAASACSSLFLMADNSVVSVFNLSGSSGDSLLFTLSPPITLIEGTPVDFRLVGQISANAVPGSLRVRLAAESTLMARDVNTENLVPVSYVPSPLWGNVVWLENRAEELRLSGTPLFPITATVGETNVTALDMDFMHPAPSGTARIQITTLSLGLRDDRGQLLAPGPILDRVSFLWKGQEVAAAGLLPSSPQLITLNLPNLTLAPGETAAASVVVDIDAGAPAISIQITVHADGISALDANTGTAVAVLAETGSTFPFTSGITQIRSPARELLVGLTSLLPAALTADGSEVPAARITFRNPAGDGATAVRVRALRVLAADRNRTAQPLGHALAGISLFRNGTLWAENTSVTVDSTTAWIAFPSELAIDPGKTESLELRATLATTVTLSSLRLGFDTDDIGIVQPGGAALSIAPVPESGQSFPLWSESGTFGEMSLEKSYANFPNPFAAGREATSFVYYLPQNGRVTLRIWTLRGDAVQTVIRDSVRPAGLHQEDLWDGKNGSGETVVNGVYLAELLVAFDDGQSRRLLRKVAVVR